LSARTAEARRAGWFPALVDLGPAWRSWDATLISVLAYAGLRPQEARELRWRDIRDRTLIANANKTKSRRTVRLLAPLKTDLAEWRMACGRPADSTYVFPGENGGQWTKDGYAQWRVKRFAPALEAAGLEPTKPYALRHSFASLLAHEGRSAVYIARQLGHGAQLSLRTYQHVIDELEDAPRVPAEDAIRDARAPRDVPSKFPGAFGGSGGD
jgi:integrase